MLLELRKIGVLPRDEDLDYPVDEVRGLFDAHGLDVSFLEADAAPADLDLVVALGGDGTAALWGAARIRPRGRSARGPVAEEEC